MFLFVFSLIKLLDILIPFFSFELLVLELRLYYVDVLLYRFIFIIWERLFEPRHCLLEPSLHHERDADRVERPEVVRVRLYPFLRLCVLSLPDELVGLVHGVHRLVVGRVIVYCQVSRASEVRVDLLEHPPVYPSSVEGLEGSLLRLRREVRVDHLDDPCDVLVRDVRSPREPLESLPVLLSVAHAEVCLREPVLRAVGDDVVDQGLRTVLSEPPVEPHASLRRRVSRDLDLVHPELGVRVYLVDRREYLPEGHLVVEHGRVYLHLGDFKNYLELVLSEVPLPRRLDEGVLLRDPPRLHRRLPEQAGRRHGLVLHRLLARASHDLPPDSEGRRLHPPLERCCLSIGNGLSLERILRHHHPGRPCGVLGEVRLLGLPPEAVPAVDLDLLEPYRVLTIIYIQIYLALIYLITPARDEIRQKESVTQLPDIRRITRIPCCKIQQGNKATPCKSTD